MILPKKSLAIFSLTSCEGCQFALLNSFEEFSQLLKYFEIKNFRLGQEQNLGGPFDVSLIEGSISSDKEKKLMQTIRKESKVVVALGACAHLGGIQSERESLPKEIFNRPSEISVNKVIKADYIIPGCPINHKEAYRILTDLYFEKIPSLPDYSVCFECRQNENKCLLKNTKPCLGPITMGGCNSICINHGEACFGCRGATSQANFDKIKEVLSPILDEEELKNWLTIYGDYEKEHKKSQSVN